MNRPRKTKGPYPPCFYAKHGAFYLVRQNKWIRLGTHLGDSLAEYAKLVGPAKTTALAKLVDTVLHAEKRAASTQHQYTYAAAVLKRKLQQFEPHEVKGKHIAGIMESLRATPNMANRILSFGRAVFNYAVARQMMDANPCIGIPRLPETKRKRLLSDVEWAAIHEKAGPRLKVIMELQWLTGQRIGDVLNISRGQLTDDGIVFEQQKTGARVLVRWSAELRSTVEAAKALSAVSAITLLRGTDGKPPNYRSVSDQWTRACKAAGVEDARLNDGRAKSATTAKMQGKDAQALLGHTSPAMTARYLRDRETPHVDGPSFPIKKTRDGV